MVVLTIISYISVYGESSTSEIRKLLDDVNEYLAEKPDSAFSVLNALEIPESEDESTMAFYAILHARAEYATTDTIKSDSLLQKAIKYYNGERSLFRKPKSKHKNVATAAESTEHRRRNTEYCSLQDHHNGIDCRFSHIFDVNKLYKQHEHRYCKHQKRCGKKRMRSINSSHKVLFRSS